MTEAIYMVGWNQLIAFTMAITAWLLCRTRAFRQRPAVCHGLWALVLLKFVTPPMLPVPVLPTIAVEERNHAASWSVAEKSDSNSSEELTTPRSDSGTLPYLHDSKGVGSPSSAHEAPSAPLFGADSPRESLWLSWRALFTAFFAGSLLVTFVFWVAAARQILQVRRLLRGGKVESARAAELLQDVSRHFHLRTPPSLVVADSSIAPMLLAGGRRPVIVVPRQVVNLLDERMLRNVLAHEIGHYVRCDHWTNLFAFAVVSLFWWNPAAWFARRELTAAADASCDALAIERVAGSRKSYAQTLLVMVDFAASNALHWPVVGVTFGQSRTLRRRFETLANFKAKPGIPRLGWLALAFAAMPLLLVPAQAQDRQPPASSPTPPDTKQNTEASEAKEIVDAGEQPPMTNSQVKSASERAGAEVSLELDKPEYFLGENVLLHWRIRNTGDKLITLNTGGDGRTPGANRAIRFKVEAIDTTGTSASDPYPNPMNMGGPGGGPDLESGQEYWDNLQLLRYREFTAPGEYTIKVYHDLGWEGLDPEETFSRLASSDIPSGPRHAPIATTTIRFVMPSAEQAQEVVDAMLAMSADRSALWGEKGATFADFELLRYPIYLPIVKKLAQNGDARGLDAIGAMAFPEATAALLELMEHDDATIAAKAGDLLLWRTPYIHDIPPSRRSYLVDRSWTDQLKQSAMEAAWKLLADDDRKNVIRGARLVHSLGAQGDLPALIEVMDLVLVKYKDHEVEQRAYLRPANASDALADASRELIRRGAQSPDSATTPGSAVAWLAGLGVDENFRPDGWRETARGLIQHEIPFIRHFALKNLPLPLDEATVALVAEAINDDFAPVQGAACELASKAKLKAFGPPLVNVLASTENDWVLRAAFGAAVECGIENDRRLEICVRRMSPRPNNRNMLLLTLLVAGAIEQHGYGSTAIDDWTRILPGIQSAWFEFIDSHRQELREGVRIPAADPSVTPRMFPPGFRVH